MLRSCLMALCLLCLAGSVAGAAEPAKVVVVAHDATSPPMEYMEKRKIIGYSVDYIDAVAKEAGFRVEHKDMDWDGSFSGLTGKQYDVLASSVTITEERLKVVNFSTPYYEVRQVLITPKNADVSSLAAMKGKSVGAKFGTTGYMSLKKVRGINALAFETTGLAISSLLLDRIDGVVCDDLVATNFLQKNQAYADKLKISFVLSGDKPEYYGFAVSQDNKELLARLNSGIAAVKAKGIEKELVKKWIEQ